MSSQTLRFMTTEYHVISISFQPARGTVYNSLTMAFKVIWYIYSSTGAMSMVCIRSTYDFYLQTPHLQSHTRDSITDIHHR